MGVVLFLAVAMQAFFQVGPALTDPVASGTETSASQMEVDLEVSAPAGGSVVAHLIEPGGGQQTVALRERTPGRYGGITEVRRIDYVVVFEALGVADGQSSPARLTEIGLDRSLVALPFTPTTPPQETAGTEWGWLGLGLGALSLALLALWALPDRAPRAETSAAADADEVDEDGA